MEKFSSIDKIVGKIPDNEKGELMDLMDDVFNDQTPETLQNLSEITPEQNFHEVEKQKTPDEKKIISLVNDATNKLSEKYSERALTIPEANVHFFRRSPYSEDDSQEFFDPAHQMIVLPEKHEAKTVLMHNLFHEMVHFKSYAALQVRDPAKKEFSLYRLGLRVFSRKNNNTINYFNNLNEAVTETLTNEFSPELLDEPLFSSESSESQTALEGIEDDFSEETFFANKITDETGQSKIRRFISPYKQERDVLNLLCEKICDKNPQDFQNKMEVFHIFAKAMFTGNILTLGRTIEKTFGKGTFRKIGELGDDTNALSAFVNSL